jgi:kynurenine formamidase
MRRHGDVVRPSGLSTANELVVLSGHTGTHLDAFGHASVQGLMHGGKKARDLESHEGLRALDVGTVSPLVARFVLFDVALETGGPPLPPGHPITDQYLSTIAEKFALAPVKGDIALVRTGWGALWDSAPRYEGAEGGIAGIDLAAAVWLATRGVAAIGADNLTVEVEPKDAKDLPVHALCLVERGIHLLENLRLEELARAQAYEGLIVVAPLRLVGASGAPARPIAFA